MERGYPAIGPFGATGPMGMPVQGPGVGTPWATPGQAAPWAMPDQEMMGMPYPVVNEILNALYGAYNDLTLQCAVASIGHYIPEMKRLPGFEAIHKANYETAYHLTTAIGAARMIMAGAREPGYFALLVTCERKSREYQQKAREAWQQMTEGDVPQAVRPYLEQIGGRIKATSGQLQRAIAMTNATLGQQAVQRLMQMSQEARGDGPTGSAGTAIPSAPASCAAGR